MTGETKWASDEHEESPFRKEADYSDNRKLETSNRRYTKRHSDRDFDSEFWDSNDFGSK